MLLLIIVLAEEIDALLGVTLGALNECGFKTQVVQEADFKQLLAAQENIIILDKHPKKKHNGNNDHRRRFACYKRCGVRAIGYAQGAKQDALWWRDLHYKLRDIIKKTASGVEQTKLLFNLSGISRLKN